jgi:nucleoside-diphosphate-sugar epimerase
MSLKSARWSTKRTLRTWLPQPWAAGSVHSIAHIAKQACRRRLTRDVQVRVVADVILLNCALLLALALHYLWSINMQDGRGSARAVLSTYVHAYVASAWLLTVIAIALFALSGFYTHGRAYRGRFKALMVAQAVTVSYLAFGCSAYLSGGLLYLPWTVTTVAWFLSMIFLGGARLWAHIWTILVVAERRALPPPAERTIKSVLVIGGDGYIGSALLPKLLAKGYRVRVLSLLLYSTDSIKHLLNHPHLEIIQADFRQVDKVVEAMHDMDAVVHLGAIVGDPACALDEDLTIDVNLTATRMIGEVAKGHGVNRFIFASTCSVYGASDEMLDERSALRPLSLYARSKIACEHVLGTLADNNFAPVYLRFGTIYGLSGRTRFDLVVNLLVAKALVDGEITVVGGDQWRPFVHVDDAALAVLKVLESPLALVRNQVFNVGSDGQNYTILQVAKLIHRLVPTARLLTSNSESDQRNYRVSFSKIRNTLGFVPLWTLEQGIRQVAEAIETGKVGDYRDAKYSNAKFLSEQGIVRFGHRDSNWAQHLINEWPVESAWPILEAAGANGARGVAPASSTAVDGEVPLQPGQRPHTALVNGSVREAI